MKSIIEPGRINASPASPTLYRLPPCIEIVSPPNAVLMHDSPKPAPPIFTLSDCQ